MYFKEECIGVQCNNCGITYEDYSGIAMWADKENLHPEESGWHVDGEVHYCKSCHHIDDDDKLHVKMISPVYEVIADFPGNKDFPVGKRITFEPLAYSPGNWECKVSDCQGERKWLSHYFDNFPHLFKKVF